MVVLRHFFANNHSLLDNLQNSNELNQSINARLPELAVESAEFEHLMASETQSELDFEVALNASISQKRIQDQLGSVLWEKLLTVSSQMNNFSIFQWQNWVILLNAIIAVLNSFFLLILSLKFKALLLLVCSQKGKADLIFTLPPKATVVTKTAAKLFMNSGN